MNVLKNFSIALDQAINCLIYFKEDGWGHPDETLSARAYRLRFEHPWVIRIIDCLFFWEPNHCYLSFEKEALRKHLHPSYSESPNANK